MTGKEAVGERPHLPGAREEWLRELDRGHGPEEAQWDPVGPELVDSQPGLCALRAVAAPGLYLARGPMSRDPNQS